MVDLMKIGVRQPVALVDITALSELEGHEVGVGRIRFGALARMAEVGDDKRLRAAASVLAESLWKAASPQLRHAARLGGNILQRTRCPYLRDTAYVQCNKRAPGSGCSALDGGETKLHAILGGSKACVAMGPADRAQATIAFDAEVTTQSMGGKRTISFADLHVLPDDTPEIETILEPGEIVTGITVPVIPALKASHYLKARARESYAFATDSAAVGVEINGDMVRDVRIAPSGVASVPWRAHEAEEMLKGRPLTEDTAREASHRLRVPSRMIAETLGDLRFSWQDRF